MPNLQDYIRNDVALTNISVKYSNDQMVWNQISPVLNVPQRKGIYYTYDKSNLRIPDSRRTGRSATNEVDYGLTKTNFGPLSERALKTGIEKDEMDHYPSAFDAMVDATESVSERMELTLEKDVADLYTNTSNLTNNITLSGTDQFSDFSNSDPIGVVKDAVDSVQNNAIKSANVIVMSYPVYSKLSIHPDILGRLSDNSLRIATPELMAAIFDVDRVIVGKAQYNTADEGQTASFDYVWNKDMIVAYVEPNPRLKSVSLGYLLRKENARYVDRWREVDPKTDYVRVNDYYDPHIVAAEAGYLIKNAVA